MKYNTLSSYVTTYNSLNELCSSVTYDIRVPSILKSEDNLTFTNFGGGLIEIRNDIIEFKASNINEYGADVGGYYEDYVIDKTYKTIASESLIENLRVRTNSDSLDNMNSVIVSYKANGVLYSLKIDKQITFNEVLEIFELSSVEEISK